MEYQYLVTASLMKQYDQYTIETIGIPGMVLMERAALAAQTELQRRIPDLPGRRILVAAGVGNNGGDGLALARLLGEMGCACDVVVFGDPQKATAQWKNQLHILEQTGGEILDTWGEAPYDVVVDAIFGVGLSRDVKGDIARAIDALNKMPGFKLSLDVPSGIDSDTGKVMGCAFRADVTVTFGFCKIGICRYPGAQYAGEIVTAHIGITERAFAGKEPFCYTITEEPGRLLPGRDPAGNKGTFGKCLVIGGGVGMAGAALLAAKACYRVGAGMVRILGPKENTVIVQSALPEALFGTWEELSQALGWADVILIGPGLGRDEQARGLLEAVCSQSRQLLVIDADAIWLLAEHEALSQTLRAQCRAGRSCILTPHPGELQRLLERRVKKTAVPMEALKEKLQTYAEETAAYFGAVVVAKDARSFVCKEGQKDFLSLRGSSALAVAGSGDVLAGMLAGLLAQGMPDYETGVCGTLLHGRLGELAGEKRGEYACIAGDFIQELEEYFRGQDSLGGKYGNGTWNPQSV